MERLNGHIQRSESDLLAWLESLSPKAEEVSYDPCHPQQTTELLATMANLYEQLGASETGKRWLCKQYGRPTTLAGLALFNFNPELSALIDKVSANFSTYGTIDDQGRQGDGSGQAHGGLSDTTSEVSRAGEVKSVLDLPSVQSSQLYKSLSEPAKRAFETLRNVVGQKAKDSWNLIAFTLLPALSTEFAPKVRIFAFSVTQVLVSKEISSQTQLILDADFAKKNRKWQMQFAQLEKQIKGLQRTLALPGKGPDKRSAHIQLGGLEQQRETLNLQRPNEIVGAIASETRITTVQTRQVNMWLATLGQSELLDQLQLKVKNAAGHAARSRQWVNQELGGSLPVLVAGLNIWNFLNSLDKANNDGILSADELRTVSANAAYTANALMALWVVPAWNKWASIKAVVNEKTVQLAQVGVKAWGINSQYGRLARSLALRTAGMAAFGAIAAGVEAWQVSKDIDKSTSPEERYSLRAKQITLGLMSAVAGVQLIGSALGFWFGFAWVMSNPVTIIIALLGVIYLISSMIANQYKREGLRLWLYRCSWGKTPPGATVTRTTRTNYAPCARSACAPAWWPGRPACPTTIAAPVRTQASGYSSCYRLSWLAQTCNCKRLWSTVAGSPTALCRVCQINFITSFLKATGHPWSSSASRRRNAPVARYLGTAPTKSRRNIASGKLGWPINVGLCWS